MQAIRIHNFGGPEVLKLEDLPTPTPSATQVLIEVRAIGVNPVETYIRSGIYGPRAFPLILGADAAGVVVSTGPAITRFKPGDRVYTIGALGAYATHTLAPANRVFPLPDHISFAQGAALGVPYGTAYYALFHRGRAKPAETLLIHGASGGVGTAATQLARNLGMTILATAGTDEGLDLIRAQGATHAFNHHDPDYLKQIMDATAGRGVDLILEMLANVNLANDLTLLAKFGRVVVIGSRGNIEITPRETMSRNADIRGMTLFNATEEELTEIHTALGAGLSNRTLNPIIAQEFPLKEAAKAHEAMMLPGSKGKIVMIPIDEK